MNKGIRLSLCALFCALLIGIISCTPKSDADTSLEKIQQKGFLILGLDTSLPPLGFVDETNTIVGFDIDLAREVCKKLGVELRLQPIDWAAKEQELNTGGIDCIWNGFTITEEREKALLFSEAYLENTQAVIVRSDSAITHLSDLAGKKVGFQSGSSAAEAIDANYDFKSSLSQLVEFRDNLNALMDLEIGGVDAVVMDSVVAQYSIKTTGKPFIILDENLAAELYGVGFRKTDQALRDAVQKALDELKADGTEAAIAARWFSDGSES